MFGMSLEVMSTATLGQKNEFSNVVAKQESEEMAMRYQLPENWNRKRREFVLSVYLDFWKRFWIVSLNIFPKKGLEHKWVQLSLV